MSSCLGMYIEDNIIKYAKMSEDRDIIKLEAFGIKFYEQLEEAVEQIVNETLSYKIPISINLKDEQYNYFEMFSMLNEKDMQKAINTEFELLCEEKGYNKNLLDSRSVLINNVENKDITIAMNISANKSEIIKQIQEFQKYNLKSITPLPLAITNNIEIGVKENAIILNLEEETTLTTIINGQVNKVEMLENKIKKIIDVINKKENSYAKVYDILKNTTLYTLEGRELQEETNEYLEDIMPVIYSIANETKKIASENVFNIDKLYITGTGAVINNIDLYFQEYFSNAKCEILKPYFMKNVSTQQFNVKDYIEVNSAIGLALQELGQGIKTINFKKTSVTETIKNVLNQDIALKNNKTPKKTPSEGTKAKLKFDLNAKIDNSDKTLIRLSAMLLCIIIIYSAGSITIGSMIEAKKNEVDTVLATENKEIQNIEEDTQQLNLKVSDYTQMINNLDNINAQIQENNSYKNSIPNLLMKIMSSIPKNNVQLLKIENLENKHIRITARSLDYTSLGLFVATLEAEETLLNVKSNSSVKQNDMIVITIEGDMP